MKGYLATHFFNEAGFEWTAKLAEKIRKETGIELYVPQENDEINDKEKNDATITDVAIYEADTEELLDSNILIACLDGVDIDSGVSAEIGLFSGYIEAVKRNYIYDKPRIIIAIYTDMRRHGTGDNHHYINLYTKGACSKFGKVVHNSDDLIKEINDFIQLHAKEGLICQN